MYILFMYQRSRSAMIERASRARVRAGPSSERATPHARLVAAAAVRGEGTGVGVADVRARCSRAFVPSRSFGGSFGGSFVSRSHSRNARGGRGTHM
jgi:hypothetical protein